MPVLFILMGIYLGLMFAGYMVTFSDISPVLFISIPGYIGLITLYLVAGIEIVLDSKNPRVAAFITNKFIALLTIMAWIFVIPDLAFLDLLDRLAKKYYPNGDN